MDVINQVKKCIREAQALTSDLLGILNSLQQNTPLPNTLILDTFSDLDGTNLSLHVPNKLPAGSSWQRVVGNFSIFGNLLKPVEGNNAYQIDCGQSYVTISCDLNLNLSDTEIDLYGNSTAYNNGNTYFQCLINPSAGTVKLTNNGTQLALASYSFVSGPQTFSFVITDSGLDFQVNGVTVVSYTGTISALGTFVALQAAGANSTFSQFLVTQPGT